ncbi:hypothetical protein [Mycolicibacterium llatzerense]|uniref:hypothetical protein n=1 Tax=Mycolicibacterium llatzerense TaxID=280871 RepID=UPI0021B65AD0|nr:hypothetical protein [Mycolicibacterium llatzerense]MCT7372113.1 hypothetical protein [Mycolicibacterium llatzerense]
MIRVLAGVVVGAFLLVPLGFVAFIGGPQAATESTAIGTACALELGAAPLPHSTVAELGGTDAAMVAAALTQETTATPVATAAPATTVAAVPAETVVSALVGDRAYEFVTTLNSIDNWRTLPVDAVARWALDPAHVAQPAGAAPLPELPAAQTTAMHTDEQQQPTTAYARGCAAVVARATASTVHPAGDRNGNAVAPDPAALAALAGTSHTNLELLRAVNPLAVQDDPRQFYLDYRPQASIEAGNIVVYDYTVGGPAHFGIAIDEQQMLTTGSVHGGVVQTLPIPVNRGVMTARPARSDQPTTASNASEGVR